MRLKHLYYRTDNRTVLKWNCDTRSEEHTSELQSQSNLVCRLLLEKKNHLVVGVVEIAADCERALIGEQQPLVRPDVLGDGGRQPRLRRRPVVGDRDAAERADHLR